MKKIIIITVALIFLVFLGRRVFSLITESDQGFRGGMRGGQPVKAPLNNLK